MTAYHRQKGSSFERLVADYFKANGFPFADRRVKNGAKDKGDIGGVGTEAGRLVLECKNTSKINLGMWAAEAEQERVNDEALAGVIVHKRHGKGKAGEQWVTMPLADLVAILTGVRP
jgi:Holliday junction resolvase